MRSAAAVSVLAFLASCMGAPLPRVEAPPPRGVALEVTQRSEAKGGEDATQQWLRDEVARQRGETAPEKRPGAGKETVPFAPKSSSNVDGEASVRRSSTDDDATNAWLRNSADQRRAEYEAGSDWHAPVQTPGASTSTTTVERTVYVDRYVAPVGYGYDCYGNPIYYSSYGYRPYRSTFPFYTVTGATIGAFTSGCQASGSNIAVGAGIGFLFDVGSCW